MSTSDDADRGPREELPQYSLISDSGPNEDQIRLTIWLPRLTAPPRLRYLRTVAELYALATKMNAKGQQRFGIDVVSVRLDSDDGDHWMEFEFDDGFNQAYPWRDEIAVSATRIIASHGGVTRES